MYALIRVKFDESGGSCVYYSGLAVEKGDKIVVETKYGPAIGEVQAITKSIKEDPFSDPKYCAKRHVLENTSKKLYKEERKIMAKVIQVKHISSNKSTLVYTDMDLSVNDTVVFERNAQFSSTPARVTAETEFLDGAEHTTMSVGIVVSTEVEAVTAAYWVVDKVDMAAHYARKERAKQARKLKAKLDQKRKQFQDIELLRLIAESDPETKTMLEEYTKLLG